MALIVPAIIPTSRDDLEKKLSRLDGLVENVQVDVVDGRFAGPVAWPYNADSTSFEPLAIKGETLPYWERFKFEADLMVSEPIPAVDAWIEAGATRINLHMDPGKPLDDLLTHISSTYGHDKDFTPGLLSLGLTLPIGADLARFEPYLERIDYVQFMGISRIGHQGEPFDERIIPVIRAFRKEHRGMMIQVDGGVTLDTAPGLLMAGVSRLIVGHALWQASDLEAELKKFEELNDEHGIYE